MNESTILTILKASFDQVIGPRGFPWSIVMICMLEPLFGEVERNGQQTLRPRVERYVPLF